MTTETEWKDLPTLQDVAKAQADNWEIQYSLKGREYFAWSESAWDSSTFFRGRPRQPKMEYCPDEMTKEQLVEWAKHQQIVVDTGGMMK